MGIFKKNKTKLRNTIITLLTIASMTYFVNTFADISLCLSASKTELKYSEAHFNSILFNCSEDLTEFFCTTHEAWVKYKNYQDNCIENFCNPAKFNPLYIFLKPKPLLYK